jgi:hypothetical protein
MCVLPTEPEVAEYLDIRWASIERFIEEAEPLYKNFLKDVKAYLEKQL